MPIYEFYCRSCHRIYNFLSRSAAVRRGPDCPVCGANDLKRRPSRFAISKGRSDPVDEHDLPGVDDDALERVMSALGDRLDGLDENDPRQVAGVMREVYEAVGLPIGGNVAEAIRRLESGEDPESIEEDLGDALEGEDLLRGGGLRRLKRRLRPPEVDETLYEW